MKEQINQLITRLLDRSLAPGETLPAGTSFDSSKTVATKASPEIRTLPVEAVPVLKDLILHEKNTDRRSEAYSILKILASQFNDTQIAYFIIDQLAREKNKFIIYLTLTGLKWSKLQLEEKQDIILQFTENKSSQIRHSAISLLGSYTTQKELIESRLIQILETSNDEYDLTYTNAALSEIGSKKSAGALKKIILENKKTDVLSSAIYALGKVDGPNQVDFFIEMIPFHKGPFIKSSLIELIAKHTTDGRAIDVMIERIKSILAKERKTNYGYGKDQQPELVHALQYLQKHKAEDTRIPALEKWILEKKVSFLDETEKKWILENCQA